MKVIDDAEASAIDAGDVRRLILCTGKIAVDLLTSAHRARQRRASPSAASSSSTRCP